jgi:hypothetical protein
VTATIYVEGGGDTEYTLRRCRQGFSEYCEKIAPRKRCFAIVACGGRGQTFSRFSTELEKTRRDDLCVLLVDSEGPVNAGISSKDYLQRHDGWRFTTSESQRVFLMVQAMEAWFLADRDAMAAYYGRGFRRNDLPGHEREVEGIRKEDLEPSLANATRDVAPKEPYHKTKHGFVLLGLIDPRKVEAGSSHAVAFHEFLRSL